MNTIWPLALLTCKDGMRYRVMYGILVCSLLLVFFTLLTSGLFMRDILKVIVDICLSAVALGGLLVPFFLASNLLSGDIEQKSVYTILSRPVTRGQYVLGKFFGLLMLTFIIMGTLTTATLLTVWGASFIFASSFLASLSLSNILIACAMSFLGVLVLQSVSILWSLLTTSAFLATLLTLATYIIGQTVEDMVRFMTLESTGVHISAGVQKTVHVVMYIFPNLAAFDLKKYAAYGLDIPAGEVLLLVVYGCAYIVAALTLAVVVFRRRDIA